MSPAAPRTQVADRSGPSFARFRAICFDLDGTLYDQGPLRRTMAARIAIAHLASPVTGYRTFRVLSAYRRAQEHIRRGMERNSADIAEEQLRLCSSLAGCDCDEVRQIVQRWFEEEPLAILHRFVRPGATDFLTRARRLGLKLAVVSDYPAAAKLRSMCLLEHFDVVVSAQQAGIQSFKPNPAGLLWVLRELGVSPREMLYVGDRPSIDAEAATFAGLDAIMFTTEKPGAAAVWRPVRSFTELAEVIHV